MRRPENVVATSASASSWGQAAVRAVPLGERVDGAEQQQVTARCVEVAGGRLTCALTAVDGYGRLLGRGTTGQAVLPEAAVEARGGEPARRARGPSTSTV